ncbi:RidA family protein [Azoarcus sp. TTM-91]|jgi:enamine deaminase RidA (YjgF/YER057c/UK114 family)|uniref:Enamine deaminase RidA (YjgF/YER057c/UK114 family) n=1 Tax=Azoarcus indigens TaxID=29545 RepID=A0A4R6DFI1_9RHOO|nr:MULTISPECIES: RidA family protein [Azoarcus]NMG36473.1 RidA family protein [Azoarcus sp. TTM-91]NMG67824.1 RidA family protein [Azoarcus indigens]TDN43243.1 enamine deaminase RidA (YjgF/YER057c/UK114 family) [Azoarcus indigens]
MHKTLQPEGWLKPRGYANGIEARGRQIFVGGQIGWNGECRFESTDLVQQVFQALSNIREVMAVAGAGPEHMVRMTWYLKDKKEYNARLKEIGAAYREVMGKNFPAMTAVQVADLVEDEAQVEIEVTAVIPD